MKKSLKYDAYVIVSEKLKLGKKVWKLATQWVMF